MATTPANGGPSDPFGIFRVVDFAPADEERVHAVFGDSYVAAIEFDRPPAAGQGELRWLATAKLLGI